MPKSKKPPIKKPKVTKALSATFSRPKKPKVVLAFIAVFILLGLVTFFATHAATPSRPMRVVVLLASDTGSSTWLPKAQSWGQQVHDWYCGQVGKCYTYQGATVIRGSQTAKFYLTCPDVGGCTGTPLGAVLYNVATKDAGTIYRPDVNTHLVIGFPAGGNVNSESGCAQSLGNGSPLSVTDPYTANFNPSGPVGVNQIFCPKVKDMAHEIGHSLGFVHTGDHTIMDGPPASGGPAGCKIGNDPVPSSFTACKLNGTQAAWLKGNSEFFNGPGSLTDYVQENPKWNAYDVTGTAGAGIPISPSPKTLVINGVPHIYGTSAAGHLIEYVADHLNNKVWNAYDQTATASQGVSIVGTAAPILVGEVVHAYAQGASSGHLIEFTSPSLAGQPWKAEDISAKAGNSVATQGIVTNPSVIFVNNTIEVFSQTFVGSLVEYTPDNLNGHTWNAYNLTASVSPTNQHYVTANPTGAIVYGGVAHVYAQDISNGNLIEYVNDNVNGRNWNDYDQTALAGGGVAVMGTTTPILASDGTIHAYAEGSLSGHLIEFVADGLNGHVWNAYDLTTSALGGTPIVNTAVPQIEAGIIHAYTQSSLDGHLIEFAADHLNNRVWNAYDLTATSGNGTPILGMPSPLKVPSQTFVSGFQQHAFVVR